MKKINHLWGLITYIVGETIKVIRNKKTWYVVGFIVWTYLVGWVFNHYYFQSPVKEWRCFMCSREVNKVSTDSAKIKSSVQQKPTELALKPVRTEYDIVMEQKHGSVLWNIYMLESTRGKNDGCRLKGEGWGGFGVMSKGEVVCYESFEKAVERAEYWLVKAGVDKDLDRALCLWNTGTQTPMCNYSIAYHSL